MWQKIDEAASKGLHAFWVDETHFTTKTKLGRAWLARGLSIMCKIKPYGKSCTCFAALGAGEQYTTGITTAATRNT